jgi:RND family efflux transporter MFP subunit
MAASSAANLSELESLRITRSTERKTSKPYLFFLVSLVVIAALAGAGYAAYQRTLGRPPAVETVMVTSRPADQPGVLLMGSGYVVTRHKYIVIGTKILGQIVEEPIEEGQRVKRGDLLARVDDRDYEAQLQQAIANRELAEANLQLAHAKAAREHELYSSGIISKDEFETFDNAAKVAEATVKRDEAAIDYAKFQVGQCVIVSPIDGVVLQKYRELGDTINYGGQVQTGGGATDIAQLADTADMRAEVDINESDIAKVWLGMPALVVPDAYADARFEATLVKIYPEADRQKATVKVEVQIHQPNLAIIKPELSVKANFLEKRTEAKNEPRLVIPGKSLQREGSKSYVWTVRNGMAKRMPILVGREMVSGIEVKQGLKDGDILIVAPPTNLSDGQTIRATSGATIVR